MLTHGCCLVPSSVTPPSPTAWQRVLVSSINSRLSKHFTRFQRAAALVSPTSSAPSYSNRTLPQQLVLNSAENQSQLTSRWRRALAHGLMRVPFVANRYIFIEGGGAQQAARGSASLRRADTAQVCNHVGFVRVDGKFECSAPAARQIVSERW